MKGKRNATLLADAATCMAHGSGSWRASEKLEEPYLVETSRYLPHFNLSAQWWGGGDDDVRRSLWAGKPRRPPRAEIGYAWEPQGDGCDALREDGSSTLPTRQTLVQTFCERWRGRKLLFVGDSTSATAFTSLAHIIGFVNTTSNTHNPCYWRKLTYGPAGRGAQEVDLRVQLCEPAPGGVLAQFLRNEDLGVSSFRLSDQHEKPAEGEAGHGRRLLAMACDWAYAAEWADFAVVNTGLWHHGSVHSYLSRMNATLSALVPMLKRSGRAVSRSLLYRSSWAAVVGCGNMSDPLTPQQAADAFKLQSALGSDVDRYNWTDLQPQNIGMHKMAQQWGVPFWDAYPATLMRPGGHRGVGRSADCVHYWLPGPPDGLTLQLLSYLNLVV